MRMLSSKVRVGFSFDDPPNCRFGNFESLRDAIPAFACFMFRNHFQGLYDADGGQI